ncbi:MAG: hypothetical protein HC831_26080 [Chloroflexia bacterium]|nr:hypothetical protein [Chloroflexia bacterium]
MNSDKINREDFINELFASPNLIINTIDYKEDNSENPKLTIENNLIIRDLASKTKRRMLFNPYLFEPASYFPKTKGQNFKITSSKFCE